MEQQYWYVSDLLEEMLPRISGLAMYDAQSSTELPEQLLGLPRLALTMPDSPHTILKEISLGMDLFVLPFANFASEAGIALDFSFSTPSSDGTTSAPKQKPLGIDLWETAHSVDVSPLSDNCTCYACSVHHRAYIQHLLHAKEMLAWVLLQIHNHHVLDQFFAAIQASIERGTFESDAKEFERIYEPKLPMKTGFGPRYGS